MEITPVTIKEARKFIREVHRHHPPPVGALFAVAVSDEDEVVGVATIGRPVSRVLDDTYTVEVTRVAVKEGYPNACSMLYGASWRAARALGYRKAITYTLVSEKGTSVKASNWKCIGKVTGRSWSTPSRPRVDSHPMEDKLRWEIGV